MLSPASPSSNQSGFALIGVLVAIALLAVIGAGTRSTSYYLKRLHNFAVGFGWLPGPIIANKAWPP